MVYYGIAWEDYTVKELRSFAKEAGLFNYTGFKKRELVDFIKGKDMKQPNLFAHIGEKHKAFSKQAVNKAKKRGISKQNYMSNVVLRKIQAQQRKEKREGKEKISVMKKVGKFPEGLVKEHMAKYIPHF